MYEISVLVTRVVWSAEAVVFPADEDLLVRWTARRDRSTLRADRLSVGVQM